MSRKQSFVRAGLVAGAVLTVFGCTEAAKTLAPPLANSIFLSYVSLGNSLTAGWQSGGINDSTQQRAYPVIVARQMGTRFAYPSLTMPGCPPPEANFVTGALVGGATATTCLLRNPKLLTAIINNVGVPGATTFDPDSAVGPNGSILTELILGGKTQVQRALVAHPTFASVWIGNNDILGPTVIGYPAFATPQATFQANYSKMINDLVAGAPGLKGILIGVVKVSLAPLFFSDSAAVNNSAFKTAIGGIPFDPTTCGTPGTVTSDSAFTSTAMIGAIKAGKLPPIIYCAKPAAPPYPSAGDTLQIDKAETALIGAKVGAYNAYIKAKADSIGFAFWDPNTLGDSLRAGQLTAAGAVCSGTCNASTSPIPRLPNLGSTTAPFGTLLSLDGVHPTSALHTLIAQRLIATINAKYGTTVPLP